MEMPDIVPVMVLTNATLFPQALLPLYMFEPRYKQMTTEVLEGNRLFAVALRKPGSSRETPFDVAGLGLLRVAVRHPNGTYHLILQGLARVRLRHVVRYKPYRRYHITPILTAPADNGIIDGLLAKVRDLVRERCKLGNPFGTPPPPLDPQNPASEDDLAGIYSPDKVMAFLQQLDNTEHVVDMVSSALLSRPGERQMILSTPHLETRLRYLVHFLVEEIRRQKSDIA